MTLYHATSILWDTDDDANPFDLGLPEDALVFACDPENIPDLLADEYGWCVLSCEYERADGPDPMDLSKAWKEDRALEDA